MTLIMEVAIITTHNHADFSGCHGHHYNEATNLLHLSFVSTTII